HAGIPGATVTVANLATNVARTVTTTAEGQYVVTPLDPGIYRVSAEIQGFQPAVRDGVELTVGQSVRVELALALSTISTDVQVTEEHQGGTWIQTSVDALQEFSVHQNAYSAEFHGAGATFNAVTKSGTNAFHGSLFEFLRNDAFDARNFFAQTKEKLERNQFGSTLGGPVRVPGIYDGRKKTFFFASYEGQRRRQGNVRVSIVPTAAQRAGNFSGLAPIYDPLTTTPSPSGSGAVRTLFPNNIIPLNRLSPQAQFFNQYI